MSIHKFDHHIQADIFAKLRASDWLRYSQLKDPLLESSQFVYHLNELVRRGLIEKFDRGKYRLSKEGISLAQHFSSEKNALRVGVLSYSMIYVRSETGKWLLVNRKKQPFFGFYASLSGKIHMGETLKQAAEREVSVLGLEKLDLKYAGYISILINGENIETHITGPIWFIDNCPEFDTSKISKRSLSWENWQDLPYKKFIPGWKESVAVVESGKPDFLDLKFSL